MATAQTYTDIRQVTVVKEVTEDIAEERILLDLSPEEAKSLLLVLNRIGGDPEMTARKWTGPIARVLEGLMPRFHRQVIDELVWSDKVIKKVSHLEFTPGSIDWIKNSKTF